MILLVLAAIFYILLGNIQSGALYFFVAFPAVLMHELAHLMVAFILKGRPESINLVPTKQSEGYWTLGSVEFHPTWWNGGFVALAPLYLLPLFAVALYYLYTPESYVEILVAAYLLACLVRGAVPSRADWLIAFMYPVGTIIVLLALGGVGFSFRDVILGS